MIIKKSYILDVLTWVVFPLILVIWFIVDSSSLGGILNELTDVLFWVVLVSDIICIIASIFKKNK